MSDESQPPPPSLRLRPRLSAGEAEAGSEAGATTSRADGSASPSGADDGAQAPLKAKIRLRPRLSANSQVEAPLSADSPEPPSDPLLSPATIPPSVPSVSAVTIPAADAVASVPTIRLKPRATTDTERSLTASNAGPKTPPAPLTASPGLSPPVAARPPTVPDVINPLPLAKEPTVSEVNVLRTAVTPEAGKLKLKSADAMSGDPALLVGALPNNPTLGEGSPVPPVALTPGPLIKRTPPPFPVLAPESKRSPPPRIPHLAARESASAGSHRPARKAKLTPRWLMLLGLAVAGGGAYFSWTHFRNIPAEVAPTSVAPRAVTPSETLNALASVPVQAVQKAQEVLVSRQEGAQSVVDIMATETEGASKQTPRPPASVPVPPPAMAGTTATATVAPGLAASMPIAAAADASAAFREFVANAKISGVAETRALINGRLVRTGEIVDPALGIRFHAVDRETKQLIFRDFSGAQVGRRY